MSKIRQGEFVVVSDSMMRGVISELARDSKMFSGSAIGGAKIEDLNRRLLSEEILLRNKHLVLCVGTNNLSSDGTELIMRKYRDIFETLENKNTKTVL